MAEQAQVQTPPKTPPQAAPKAQAQGAAVEELKAEGNGQGKSRDMDFLLDIPLEITVQLGRVRMLIKDLLQLGQGSVVELEKIAGEPMEILVNDKLVARGEVVVVNEKFGVRLTDIISPTERIRQLK
jgi:flagellar motor switch protein FliN/FliY